MSSSTSLAKTASSNELSSSIIWLSIEAKTGASFIALTVKVKVVLSINSPSVTVTVTSSLPL